MSEWSENAEKIATEKNLEIVRPEADELFVDIDDRLSLDNFHICIGILGDLVTGFVRKPSPSGLPDRFHVTVTLSRDVKDDFERIALQAMLGSDRKHEILSWMAAMRGAQHPTLFFEKPGPA